MSMCPSPDCHVKHKGSSAFDKTKFPIHVTKMLTQKKLLGGFFEQCNYCDCIWTEETTPDKKMVFTTYSYEIGSNDVANSKMIWHDPPIVRRV